TTAFFISGQVWGLLVPGPWFLAAFGLFGAGELIGVYAPNYILSASRRADVRRNLALATLVALPSAVFGPLFGWITDHYNTYLGVGAPAAAMALSFATSRCDGSVGFRLSFAVCGAIMAIGFLLVLFGLPAQPQPEEDKLSKLGG